MLFLLSLILVLQFILFRKVFGVKSWVSPIYIVLYFYLSTGIIGYIVYSVFPDFTSLGYTSIVIDLTAEDRIFILQRFLIFINEIIFGAIIFLALSKTINGAKQNIRNKSKKLTHKQILQKKVFSEKNKKFNSTDHDLGVIKQETSTVPLGLLKPPAISLNPTILIFLCIIPAIFFIVGVGPEKIFIKDRYLENTISFLVSLANILIMPAVMGVGYLFAEKNSLFYRLICFFLGLLDFLLLFSIGTRVLAAFPMLITLGYWFSNKRDRSVGLWLIVLTIATFSPLIFLPLYLRGAPQHGLLPYLSYVSELSPLTFFEAPIGFLSNYLFSFPLTGEILRLGSLRTYPIDYLLISLSPLPGASVGWQASKQLALNAATPFNAIGEMHLYGDLVSFGLFSVLGMMLMFISLVFEENLRESRIIYASILFMLIFVFVLNSLQYNIRTSTRILYLAFVLSFFFKKRPAKENIN